MEKLKIISLCLLCMILTGCGGKEKEVKTINDYQVACENNGLTMIDKTEQYKNDSYITNSKACILNDEEIEMVAYDSSDSAKKAQDNQIEQFKSFRSTSNIIEKDKGKNYYKYTMITNGYYIISSRVDNTLIFTRIKLDDKEAVDKLLNELDY